MIIPQRLGIWMDHTSANLIEFSVDSIDKKIIESKFTHQQKEHSLSKSENVMHNKEQHQQAEYYKELGEVIRHYEDVILFGPTDAKSELHNSLKTNHLFEKIKIETQSADKMTDHEQHLFVKNYFQHKI